MAGANKILSPGTIICQEGDPANGMYIIRKGELEVYLVKDGAEVSLAKIGAGNIVGEMAFFDQQPRSASIRASSETEITVITNDDFAKLLKQIPKWFVSLMQSLSGRLRQTNARLQKLEAKQSDKPMDTAVRCLQVLYLLWHKDGVKAGKSWTIPKAETIRVLETFGEDREDVGRLLQALGQADFVDTTQDDYNNVLLSIHNRNSLQRLGVFARTFVGQHNEACLPQGALEMLKAVAQLAERSPYETITIDFEEVVSQGKANLNETAEWGKYLAYLKSAGDGVKLVKAGSGIGIKVLRKDFKEFVRMHNVLAAVAAAGF